MNTLRKTLKLPLKLMLAQSALREKIAYELRTNHSELLVSIPLSNNVFCPVYRDVYLWSFSEIFLNAEYGNFIELTGLPKRWIDLGCHAGYFSLYLAWRHAKANGEFAGLLVDADETAVKDAQRLINYNRIDGKLDVLFGVIADTSSTEQEFFLEEGMGSSLGGRLAGGTSVKVPVLQPEYLINRLPGPYDLIKVDIEGGERELFENYGAILSETTHLILEWHSWNTNCVIEPELQEKLDGFGFELKAILREGKLHQINGKIIGTGCNLYSRVAKNG